jgi:hypothetical protein
MTRRKESCLSALKSQALGGMVLCLKSLMWKKQQCIRKKIQGALTLAVCYNLGVNKIFHSNEDWGNMEDFL